MSSTVRAGSVGVFCGWGVLVLGCGALAAQDEGGEWRRVEARDAARLVMERHCGDCHVPESPSALPGALAIYDLREVEWAGRMSEGQLRQLERRLREGPLFDPFDSRNAGQEAPPGATEEEIILVRRYVDLELARRR